MALFFSDAGENGSSQNHQPQSQSNAGGDSHSRDRSIWPDIYRLAGIAGVNPDPLTLRELLWMSEARGEFEWQQTAAVMALHANMNRAKGKPPISPDQFNPYAAERVKASKRITPETLHNLKPLAKKKSE
jgi:hypothetical protein